MGCIVNIHLFIAFVVIILKFSEQYVQLCGNRPGQIMNPVTNVTEEIDECALMPQMCNHGKCVNTPGSFRCICDVGYTYDEFSHQCIGKSVEMYFVSPRAWRYEFLQKCHWFQMITNVSAYLIPVMVSLGALMFQEVTNVSAQVVISLELL